MIQTATIDWPEPTQVIAVELINSIRMLTTISENANNLALTLAGSQIRERLSEVESVLIEHAAHKDSIDLCADCAALDAAAIAMFVAEAHLLRELEEYLDRLILVPEAERLRD